MIQEIRTVDDVTTFFNELHAEDLNFHPDDDFSDYINYETKELTYTDVEAALRNQLLEQSFAVCEHGNVDIYKICIDIFMQDFYKLYPPED